ncbi:dimethylaniline monooxygenase 2 [Ophiostoma piceae UAMH 11346]|uniref:Dimethylaniline monooxygenase 2 n=1 Tax=Ophiostoma piceae (strain UAMH 11346) TaxID=1262450 RepID=S3BMI3_OPHP1|nr:dimethylaniline monooxygenase 2 [Ophiostoma piceae UAMH 11346]
MTVQSYFERFVPRVSGKILNRVAAKMQDTAFPAVHAPPKWRIWLASSRDKFFPTVSDSLVPALESGDIKSVPGLNGVTRPCSVALDDIDVVIFYTGYKNKLGMSLLDQDTRGKPFPRLYHQIFSLDLPDPLAFMGTAMFPMPAFQLYDLTSMAAAELLSVEARNASPHLYHVIASDKRMAWPSARAAIELINAQLAAQDAKDKSE